MEAKTDSTVKNRAVKMRITYALVVVCLLDWFYKFFKILLNLNFYNILNYFSYIFQLWQANTLITTLVIIICLVGVPKFIFYLRKTFNTIGKLIKSLMKTPVIINVPIVVYLFLIIFNFYIFLPKYILVDDDDNDDEFVLEEPIKIGYWKAIRETFTLYRYSTLVTIILFFFGIYTTVTNRWTRRIFKNILPVFLKVIEVIQKFVSMTLPTPLSFLILILLNLIIRLLPSIPFAVYSLLKNRSLIWIVIVFVCSNKVYRWFWPKAKYELDFKGEIHLNDVSKLNQTRVFSLFYPRTINDIEYLISLAKSQGKTISARGQAHTMGGQTLPSRTSNSTNYVCDLKYMNRVEFDDTTKEVVAQAGATWTHVIKKLNYYGRSPVVMQSYCTFSVAGTISVNAHGITSDSAMYESVISIDYIDVNGKKGVCSRENESELFSLMIGGYGLFGIITRLRLKTLANVKTSMEYIRLQSDQFPIYYDEFLNDSTIEIKIARVDLVRPNNILMFVFRQESGTFGTVADLNDEARVMHPRQHLLYTYVAQRRLFRRIRFALEKLVARPLDLVFSSDRNTTMYESAKPMALLYQPLKFYDDTFVLQEYFIPKPYFHQWYNQLQGILTKQYQHVFLLNLTIRFVKKDLLTFLAYTKQDDSYAFVFYFRLKRNELGDNAAKDIHQQLIKLAFECHGTFYLPYRQHYTSEQIMQAYPMIEEFFEKKDSYDPIGLFSHDWYEHYRPQKEISSMIRQTNKIELITEEFQFVEQRRSNSFYTVITDEVLREKFRKFLRTVFDAEPVHVIFNYVNRAVRNPVNKNDNDVYRDLQNALKTRQFAFIRKMFALVKQIRQLRIQIDDMIRQQITIFKHLGYCGKIKNIVSMGDGGRCIKELREILNIKDGRVYVVHGSERITDIIERNSLFPVGTFIPYDFLNLTDLPIPSESIDLVVCYMGLHHLPQDQLSTFFQTIHRILRPNGLFLFREHHAYEELKPLLDVAHMVFNVVTGVDYESEVTEIRAFRTIEQWRSCLREAGFEDTFIYDEQEDDPTDDIMLVFRKPEEQYLKGNDTNKINEKFNKIVALPESNCYRACEWLVVRICQQYGPYLNHIPFYYFPYMKFLSIYWSLLRTETELAVSKYGVKRALLTPGFIMNSIVGGILTGAFVQASFISYLIRLTGGNRTEPEYEQLIIENVDEDFDFKNHIDQKIDEVQKLENDGLYAIRVPRHHAFTSILKKLALYRTNFSVISISDSTDILQFELIINSNDVKRLLWLKQRSNIDIIFEYKNPIDNTQTIVFVGVKIKYILSFIRECKEFEDDKSLTIVQIFDFFE